SIRGSEPGAGVRSGARVREEARHPRWNGGALRAGREPHGAARPVRRRPHRARRELAGRRADDAGKPGPLPRRRLLAWIRARGGEAVSRRIERRHYADLYGPTTGDRLRLGDTALIAEVERDLTSYVDECKFGGGKVLRDGQGQKAGATDAEALDCVITNALILDWTGIYKADVGIKDGRIAGIGKAGNPDTMAEVTPGM